MKPTLYFVVLLVASFLTPFDSHGIPYPGDQLPPDIPPTYTIRYSANHRYFARSSPPILPVAPGSSVIEIFDTASNPDPETATNPLWRKSVPNWDDFRIGNSGQCVIVLTSNHRIIRSRAQSVPVSRQNFTAIIVLNRNANRSIQVRRYRAGIATLRLRKTSNFILLGDVLLRVPEKATYRWYRSTRVAQNQLYISGEGRSAVFNLNTGKLVRKRNPR